MAASEGDNSTSPESEIATKLDLSVLRYSRVWEDCDILCKGLEVGPEDVVISITSSGDNVLNILLEGPQKIYSVDMSPAQNALLELKIAAIRLLEHEEFLQLIGELPYDKREDLYKKIRSSLPEYAQDFWDSNQSMIEAGIAESGRLEKYVQVFNQQHLPSVVPLDKLTSFLESQTLEEQRKAFQELPLKELKALLGWYTSKDVLKEGRSEAQFNYVELPSDEVGKKFLDRYFRCAQDVPVKGNFYFSLFNRGFQGYDPVNRPEMAAPYLVGSNFDKLKSLVDRVSVHNSTLEELMQSLSPGSITKANLSDIFEYTSVDLCENICLHLSTLMKPGGRIAYWELFATRAPPSEKFRYLEELSKRLSAQDRVFYYKSFNVYENK